MNRNLLWLLTILLLVSIVPAEAQQPTKVPRIGFLQRRVPPTPATPDPLADAFRQGLRDLGYIEGKNIVVEHRYGEGSEDRLPALVAELVQLKVDVLVIPTSQGIRAAKLATTTFRILRKVPFGSVPECKAT